MAKPKGVNQKAKWRAHSIRLAKYADRVQSVYDTLNKEIASMVLRTGYDGSKPFRFSDYPATKRKFDELRTQFVDEMRSVIYSGTSEEWKQSNQIQDLLADKVLKFYGVKKDGKKHRVYYQSNSDALKAFQNRKDNGLNLSKRLWNQSNDYKVEMEHCLSSAIEKGTSAVKLSKRLSKYLADYPSLKKDYKEKFGKAVKCSDCEYRSIRIARSEINMAYRTAEQERWKQFDFVLGYEVKTTQNGHHVSDICDELAGRYSKGFRFVGWHPNCMCYVIPILKTEEQFWNEEEVDEIKDFPAGFCSWIDENANRIALANEKGTLPYWIKDNAKVKGCALLLSKANESREYLQEMADSTALKFDAKPTKVSVKKFDSLYRKVTSRADATSIDEIKDSLRCTIVADRKDIPHIIDELREDEAFHRHKHQSTSYGYTGDIINVVMPNGIKAEIQVNTPEMIYAKERPSNAKRMIGEDVWNAIFEKTGVEGGLGHKYYEEGRVLDVVKDLSKIKEIQKKSREYYDIFREILLDN